MSSSEIDLVERFIAAFNAIDFHLQGELGADSRASFRTLVDSYARRHRWWRDAPALAMLAGLRNILVHDKIEPYQYPCVPTLATVAHIEEIRDRLVHPATAERFERRVQTLAPDDSLADALRAIRQSGYSQFPILEKARFTGLLTENSITHWLAHGCGETCEAPDWKAIKLREVLAHDARRPNWQFVARSTPVEEIAWLFRDNTYLEAVLLSATGAANEPLLGIVTRGDL